MSTTPVAKRVRSEAEEKDNEDVSEDEQEELLDQRFEELLDREAVELEGRGLLGEDDEEYKPRNLCLCCQYKRDEAENEEDSGEETEEYSQEYLLGQPDPIPVVEDEVDELIRYAHEEPILPDPPVLVRCDATAGVIEAGNVDLSHIWEGLQMPTIGRLRSPEVIDMDGENPYHTEDDLWTTEAPVGKKGARRWFCTLNNPSENELSALCCWLQNSTEYACGELEMGTCLHFQFYFRLKDAKSWSAVSKLACLKRAWIVPAKGTEQECKKYCSKDGRVVEFNKSKFAPGQGARTDVKEHALAILQNGSSAIVTMARANPMAYVHHASGWHKLAMLEDHGRRLTSPPSVTVVIGQSGTGKSTFVRKLCDEALACRQGVRVYDWNHSVYPWFPDYQDQQIWMCNDFRPQNAKGQPIPMVLFCKMFDVDNCKVEDKGGFAQLQCDTFFMSCIVHPKDWYSDSVQEPAKQLLRRITSVYECYIEAGEFKQRLIGNGEAPYGPPLFVFP